MNRTLMFVAVSVVIAGCGATPGAGGDDESPHDAGSKRDASIAHVDAGHDAQVTPVIDASLDDAGAHDAATSLDASMDAGMDASMPEPVSGLDTLAANTTCKVWDNTMPTTFPTLLSATGCFDATTLEPLSMLIPFEPRVELWSDNAVKQRWMVVPAGGKITVDEHGDFDLPKGTLLIKQFTVGGVKVETRFFMRNADSQWRGYTFEWLQDQSDAKLLGQDPLNDADAQAYLQFGKTLTDVGTDKQGWYIPSRSNCLECHTTIAGRSLGLEIAQLNSEITYPLTGRVANQLFTFQALGLFSKTKGLKQPIAELPALALELGAAPLADRARAYLHTNCSFCHREGGLSACSGDMRYFKTDAQTGLCNTVPTTMTGFPDDAKLITPGSPEKSIISLRMHAARADDAKRMPPLATSLIDLNGTDLIDAWILAAACKP